LEVINLNAQDLKNSILQLAVQGKLVEQREEEGSAEELYQQIQEEKEMLVKEGKIKKTNTLPEIKENEIPFDIPESWKWVRLGNALDTIMGQSPKGTSVFEGNDGLEFHQGKVFFGDDYLQNSNQSTNKPTKIVEPNTVLLCVRAPVGIVNITNREICIGRGLCGINALAGMDAKFVMYTLRAFKNDFIRKATGTTFVAITGEVVKNQIFPLPPIGEQKRIVAKIEELMPYVEKFNKFYSEVEELNKKFPEDMQKSILQYAIQGKLVKQLDEEGTAEELYQQIQEEKKILVKEKKIKKTNPLPEITEEEIPFDIPDSWKWTRFSEVIDVRDGTHDTPAYVLNGYPLITGKDFYNGYFELSKTKYVSEDDYKEISKRSNVEVGDILFSMIGGNIGSMILIEPDNYFEMAIKNVALFKQYTPNMIMSKYLMYYLKSQVPKIKASASGGAQAFVSLTALRSYLLPLPPIEEQKRIVKMIEDLLPYTNQLGN
jgi:type I restriction enzyme, S subunit